MKARTERWTQWLWFAALWCGGLLAAAALALLTRWVVRW